MKLKDSLEGFLFQLECSDPTEALNLLAEYPWTQEVSIHGVLLHVIADKASRLKDIQKALKSAGIEITRIEESIPSLEDVFITFIEDKRKAGDS